MANWQGPSHSRPQLRDDLPGEGPRLAYVMQLANGRYSFGVGSPSEEDAVIVPSPIASAPGRHLTDSDRSVAHRTPILLGANRIVV